MTSRALRVGWVPAFILLPWALGFQGCAHSAAPRGGPPDTIPPILTLTEPESLSVVPGFEDRVLFQFHESISEQNVQTAVTLYPFEARPRVDKGGQELEVEPRLGWVDDRIYHVEIAPVIQDLFQNTITRPITFVFSTGIPIPRNRVAGTVTDRITGEPLVGGRVDLVLLSDTLRYGTPVDSGGAFRIATLPPGRYHAIGYDDLNQDRQADDFDRADTLTVDLGAADTLALEFQVFKHDTVGPSIASVRAPDSLTLELTFDGYLDPDLAPDPAAFQVLSLPDSVSVPIDTVLHAWQHAALQRRRQLEARAAADSAAAADTAMADTTAADTLPAGPEVADTLGPAAAPPEAEPEVQPLPAEAERGPVEAVADTVAQEAQEEEPPARLPAPRLVILLQDPLRPGEYLIRVRDVVNLTGLAASSQHAYRQEPPEQEEEEGR